MFTPTAPSCFVKLISLNTKYEGKINVSSRNDYSFAIRESDNLIIYTPPRSFPTTNSADRRHLSLSAKSHHTLPRPLWANHHHCSSRCCCHFSQIDQSSGLHLIHLQSSSQSRPRGPSTELIRRPVSRCIHPDLQLSLPRHHHHRDILHNPRLHCHLKVMSQRCLAAEDSLIFMNLLTLYKHVK